MTVSLWWVAAAFFVGGYAGALLLAVMIMARDETAMPRSSVAAAAHRDADARAK